jgi:hypothetical protein
MKGNTASMIALIVAGLVLLVVGGNSYNNYLKAQYEKEYGILPKDRKPAVPVAGAEQAKQSSQPGQAAGGNVVTSTLDPGNAPPLAVSQTGPSSPYPPVDQTQPNYRTEGSPAAAGGQAAAGAMPSADPEIAQLQARLKAAEQETLLYQQKMRQMSSGEAANTPVAVPAESGSLREVMGEKGQAGASPTLFPKQGEASDSGQAAATAEFEKQIKEAAAVGKVADFNAEWGFVQIDAGKDRNIKEGSKFAVRRGVSIVGYVKVTEVSDKTSIAELTSRNKFSETARKPKPGDDLITWPLF